jgi:hypothetical protein
MALGMSDERLPPRSLRPLRLDVVFRQEYETQRAQRSRRGSVISVARFLER